MTVRLSDARLPSMWLTNCADPNTRLQSPTKKVVGCKVFQFIQTMKIKKMLGHKTLWCTYATTSSRERDELRQELCPRSQFAWTEFAQCLCNLQTVWRPLKQFFYMSRVKRREGPKNIHGFQENNIRIMKFLNLDRSEVSSSCRAHGLNCNVPFR